MPTLVLVILVAVQAAIYFHAANVALAGAARGAAVASTRGAAAHEAAAATNEAVTEMGGALAAAPEVEIGASAVVVTAVVEVPRLLPIFPGAVSRRATEPRERYIAEPER